MKFIFVGPRSIGKSTVAKLLARELNLKYFDFDEYVDRELNGIDNYVKKNGVELYRINETKILKKFTLTLPKKFVISVGGGTIASQFKKLNDKNVLLLKKLGTIIYLSPSENKKEAIKILFDREQKRNGNKNRLETEKLFKLRKPSYEKIFDLKFNVKNKSPSDIAKDILLSLKLNSVK